MIDQAAFGAGLGVIALQLNKPITPAGIKAYHAAFEYETDPVEWEAFSRVAVVRSGWTFLPTVAELRDALEEFRGAAPLKREATSAYEAVQNAGEYQPESGTQWSYRGVLEKCGRAAAEAYLAAGGHAAFSSTWKEDVRRAEFIAAYTVAARQAPADRLLPAGAAPLALPAGEMAAPPSREEAARVVARLRDLVGVEAAPPPVRQVVASDERLAELRRQAAAITTEEPAHAGEEG